ncbi:hypothetical protein T310_6729, partial [Rasamsonia emersonii CBS 393.64]
TKRLSSSSSRLRHSLPRLPPTSSVYIPTSFLLFCTGRIFFCLHTFCSTRRFIDFFFSCNLYFLSPPFILRGVFFVPLSCMIFICFIILGLGIETSQKAKPEAACVFFFSVNRLKAVNPRNIEDDTLCVSALSSISSTSSAL